MNVELLHCLRDIGFPGVDSPDLWRRVVMVVNYGRVPARLSEPEKGFKLLLLDESGETCWFARCGWASPEAMEQEAGLLASLCHDPLAALHVPESRVARGSTLFLQASRYLGDSSYLAVLADRTPHQWETEVGAILDIAERLMLAARGAHAPLRTAPDAGARRAQIDSDLATLLAEGVTERAVEELRRALVGAEQLPSELQHGDLWPANVLWAHDRWWFIDFTECGMVWSPLYDAFHTLTYAPDPAAAHWYAVDRTTDTWGEVRLHLFHRARGRRGLDTRAGGMALAYYLTHLTAYRLRPGVPREISAGLRRELERVGDFLSTHNSDPATLIPEA